MPPKKQPP
jgi:hypothetical protein